MHKPEDLTSQEEKNLNDQLRITSREAEVRENMVVFPGPSAASDEAHNDAFVKNIMDFEDKWDTQLPTSVGALLGEHTFLDAEKLTEEEAEDAINSFLKALAGSSIYIDSPQMVSAKDHYRWLCEDFVKQEITMPVGDGWNMNFLYNELVPEGPDAMNFMVETCIDDLFVVEHPSNPWTFENSLIVKEEEGGFATQLIPDLHSYITAWQDAICSVVEYEYTPLAGVRLGEELADFTFDLSYTVLREDGHEDKFSGEGTARLVYDGSHWSVRKIEFPGFAT